ncbi:MAG: hypothetical protein IKC10_00595 [Alphaproteobacteria bacterium]|nr:hypothetical protein [Alphaproteobacteria bacterium]
MSNNPTRECVSKGGCSGVYTHFDYTIANDGKTKCYYPCNSRGFGTRCTMAVDTDDVYNDENYGGSTSVN